MALFASSTGCDDGGDDKVPEPDPYEAIGQACGGPDALACPAELYCSIAPGYCGNTNASGYCSAGQSHMECEEGYDYDPVCGCDGVVYENECVAGRAGQNVGSADDCELPQGVFACGLETCSTAEAPLETCVQDVDDPDEAACRGITSCGLGQGCWCYFEHEAETCGEPPNKVVDCVEVGPGAFVVTCGK